MEIEELKNGLSEIPKGSWVHLEKDQESGKIGGIVISSKFLGQTDRDRQQEFWKYLRAKLGKKATGVGTILLYTPEEYEAMTAMEEAG